MNLLFPAMLAGLAGLGIPVALHLIAKHKFPVRDFPTLRLLMRDERTNVFAPRLIDPWQLLLRLLVLILLVLAMSRLFAPGLAFLTPTRNLVVIVDCSASMNMSVKNPAGGGTVSLLELARRKARELVSGLSAPTRCALIAAADQTRVVVGLQSGSTETLAALEGSSLKACDGAGQGLLNAIGTAAELLRGRREAKSQILVLSDLRASAFAARNQKDLQRITRAHTDLGEKLEIIFIDLGAGATENLAINGGRLRGSQVKVGDDAHILAHLHNSGGSEKSVKLQLAVGNQPDPAVKELTLAPGEQAVVDMTTPINRAVRTIAEVRLKESDALAADDSFSVPVNVAETRRVLIVNGAGQAGATNTALSGLGQAPLAGPKVNEVEEVVDGATILRYVLNPGRELGRANGTGIDTTMVTAEALAAQTLSKFELVILYDVTSLPAQSLEDLNIFVRQGRSLLMVGSGGVSALQFNRLFFSADAKRPGLSPAQLGNDQELSPALALADSASPHQWLAPFRDKLKGDLATVRFTKVRELPVLAPTASVMLAAADGRPLAVEMPLEKGRIALLAFGFELDRGNLARTRVFPSLLWRLVDYLTGQLRVRAPDVLTALQPTVIDVSEPAFAFAPELELTTDSAADAAPTILKVSAEQTVLLPGLAAGNYKLHKPRVAATAAGQSRNITVHTDPLESEMARATEPQLREWTGAPLRIAGPRDKGNFAPTGGELWRLFVWLLVLAYMAEAAFGYLFSARREKLRAAQAGNSSAASLPV